VTQRGKAGTEVITAEHAEYAETQDDKGPFSAYSAYSAVALFPRWFWLRQVVISDLGFQGCALLPPPATRV